MKVTHLFSSEETFSSGVFSVKPVLFDLELNNLVKLKWYLWEEKKASSKSAVQWFTTVLHNIMMQVHHIFFKNSIHLNYGLFGFMVSLRFYGFIKFEHIMVVTSL